MHGDQPIPAWLEHIIPPNLFEQFSHVLFDSTAYNLQHPFGLHIVGEGNRPIRPFRPDWEDTRHTLIMYRNLTGNYLQTIFDLADGLWTPNDARFRRRFVPTWLWKQWPEAEGSSVMLTFFKKSNFQPTIKRPKYEEDEW